MSTRRMLKYHIAIPAAIFAGLLVLGVPVGTAFVIGMMSGCVSMAIMMMGMMMGGMGSTRGRGRSDARHDADDRLR